MEEQMNKRKDFQKKKIIYNDNHHFQCINMLCLLKLMILTINAVTHLIHEK